MHEVLTDESKWVKGTLAKDKDHKDTWPLNPEAVAWCLIGLQQLCYGGTDEYYIVMKKITDELETITKDNDRPLLLRSSWNNDPDRKFEDVRNLLLKLDI